MKGWSEGKVDSHSQIVAMITLSGEVMLGRCVTCKMKFGVAKPWIAKISAKEIKTKERKVTLIFRRRAPANPTVTAIFNESKVRSSSWIRLRPLVKKRAPSI
jgi:type IV secretory pathway VirJ component